MKIKDPYDASASMAGYLFQVRYALLVGLRISKKNPNNYISIEKFDDITVEDNLNIISCFIQAKHHIQPGNLTDSSTDLWKTIRIWSERTKANAQFPLNTNLLILTTQSADKNSIAHLLRESSETADRNTALKRLTEVATKSTNEETKTSRDAFLNLDLKSREALVSAINIISDAPNLTDVINEIKDQLYFTTTDKKLPALIEGLEGWWWSVVATSLINSDNLPISVLEIKKKIEEIGLLFSEEKLPLLGDHEAEVPGKEYSIPERIFIKQMNLIGIPKSGIQRAISDYYKAKTQRSIWARNSLLLDGEERRYDSDLTDKWDREREALIVKDNPVTYEEKCSCGTTLYYWAIRNSVPFRNRNEIWLSAGAYHSLADQKKIGWHLDYLTLLENDIDNE